MTMSMDQRLGGENRDAARLRKQALAEFLAGWQAKHGKITAAEITKARAELGREIAVRC